jgi:hypothetical protein
VKPGTMILDKNENVSPIIDHYHSLKHPDTNGIIYIVAMYFIKNIYACINKMCILLIKDNK